MSFIYREYFAHNGLMILPILSMVLFILMFCAATFRALRRAPQADVSRLPLEEDDKGVDHG